jgi:hypothetical protein
MILYWVLAQAAFFGSLWLAARKYAQALSISHSLAAAWWAWLIAELCVGLALVDALMHFWLAAAFAMVCACVWLAIVTPGLRRWRCASALCRRRFFTCAGMSWHYLVMHCLCVDVRGTYRRRQLQRHKPDAPKLCRWPDCVGPGEICNDDASWNCNGTYGEGQ